MKLTPQKSFMQWNLYSRHLGVNQSVLIREGVLISEGKLLLVLTQAVIWASVLNTEVFLFQGVEMEKFHCIQRVGGE